MCYVKMLSWVERNRRWLVAGFFAVLLWTGVSVFQDYGVAWDERHSQDLGEMTVKYLQDPGAGLQLTYGEKYHGSFFDVMNVVVQKLAGVRGDTYGIYRARHLVCFLFFFAGVVAFYLLCRREFRSWRMGLLGCVFLVISPRIFADSFYNAKDIVLLVLMIMGVVSLLRLLERRTLGACVLHAFFAALAIDIRISGAFLPLVTAGFLVTDMFRHKERREATLAILFAFMCLVCFFVVLFWPVLWVDPVFHFREAVDQMTQFPFLGTVLYQGRDINAPELPWHYIPMWVLITTPVVYSVLFLAGVGSALARIRSFCEVHLGTLVYILCIALLCVAVMVRRSVFFDGWRHLFFIYPGLLLLALVGVRALWQRIGGLARGLPRQVAAALFIVSIAVGVAEAGWFMVRNHPYQNVYFNFLAGKDMAVISRTYEMDYWGLSYREALEYILKNDPDPLIDICVANHPGRFNALILPRKERKRLRYVKRPEEARYFLTEYRRHKEAYPYKNEYYSVVVDGAKILTVFKMP